MNLIVQEKNSKYCGQACLAMILSIPLEEAFKLVGHKKSTKTKELTKHFKAGNIKRGEPFCKMALCISRPQHTPVKGGWHWVICYMGDIYDPVHGVMPIDYFRQFYHISSHIPVL